MKQLLIIFCVIIIKIFAEDSDENDFENETVGSLLLPRLHLNRLRTKAVHDLTTARLRHLLPIPRHHPHLLLEETPNEFNDENETNNFLTENVEDENNNLTEMMKKMYYFILDEQKRNSSNIIKNVTLNEDDKIKFRDLIEENVEPIVVFNEGNLTDVENEMENKEFQGKNVGDEEIFDRLKQIFTEIVKNEINKSKVSESVNRKRRNTDKEDFKNRMDHLMHNMMNNIKNYLSNDTVLNHLYNINPKLDEEIYQDLEPFMLDQKLGIQKNFELNQKLIENDHPPIIPLKPHHFYPNFQNSLPQNYPSNDYNPLIQKSAEIDYLKSFIIHAPPNNPYYTLKRFKKSTPLLKLIADPNVKLDMPKTMENIGTVAKNSFEDDKAPMFHIRNMVGSAKNVILAALRIPPQDIMIPTQYKIMDRGELKNQKKSPEITSRFLDDSEEDKFLNTFKRMGFMLRESIKSGQETLQHMTDVAHSGRKAFVTAGYATPKFFTPYVKATAVKKDKTPQKLMLIAPRIGEVTDKESQPDPTDDYVKIGDIMDAFGVSNPDTKKIGLTRFVVHPKKNNKIQSRFGKDDKKNKDFFIVAEHIDDDKNVKNSKSIKDMVDDLREKILKKSKTSKNGNNQYEKLMENLFPLKNDDNEITGTINEDFEDIVNFDWEKFQDLNNKNKVDEIDYNELYQKIVKEKQ